MTATPMADLLARIINPTPVAEVRTPLDTTFELPAGYETQLAELTAARELAKRAKAAIDAITAEVKQMAGDATIGVIDGKPAVQLAQRSRRDIDKALLLEAYPEAFEACNKSSTYRTVTPL